MKYLEKLFMFPVSCFVYVGILSIINLIAGLIMNSLANILLFLSNAMFIEGGLCLTLGGLLEFSSSISVRKVSEILFNSKPWVAKQHKKQQEKLKTIIITGVILFFAGFPISLLA